MHIPKRFFHDGVVLVLVAANSFLTILTAIIIGVKLDTARGSAHIVQFRSNLGSAGYKPGDSSELVTFIFYSVSVLAICTIISMRLYHLRKQLALTILALGTLLLLLGLIVSNALLVSLQ